MINDKDYTGIDKLMHFGVCACLAVFSTELAVGAALGKEYGDKVNEYNHWCWWDILADVNGIALGTIVRIAIIHRYNWF